MDFVGSSWELYRAELEAVTFPVFVHCYLTLVNFDHGSHVSTRWEFHPLRAYFGGVGVLGREGGGGGALGAVAFPVFVHCPLTLANFDHGDDVNLWEFHLPNSGISMHLGGVGVFGEGGRADLEGVTFLVFALLPFSRQL